MKRRRADLDRMVEAVLAGQPLPSGQLDADDVDALRAAIELRSGRPGSEGVDEEFFTGLRRRLVEASADGEVSTPLLGRRAVLTGAAAAVAAGVVGAVAENRFGSRPSRSGADAGRIVPRDGTWVAVATAAELTDGQPRRFVTASTVGFVTERNGTLSGLSGACTHQGCLLRFNEATDRLDCPCHRTAFGLDGRLVLHQLDRPPPALPTIAVRSRDGQVEAFLPRPT